MFVDYEALFGDPSEQPQKNVNSYGQVVERMSPEGILMTHEHDQETRKWALYLATLQEVRDQQVPQTFNEGAGGIYAWYSSFPQEVESNAQQYDAQNITESSQESANIYDIYSIITNRHEQPVELPQSLHETLDMNQQIIKTATHIEEENFYDALLGTQDLIEHVQSRNQNDNEEVDAPTVNDGVAHQLHTTILPQSINASMGSSDVLSLNNKIDQQISQLKTVSILLNNQSKKYFQNGLIKAAIPNEQKALALLTYFRNGQDISLSDNKNFLEQLKDLIDKCDYKHEMTALLKKARWAAYPEGINPKFLQDFLKFEFDKQFFNLKADLECLSFSNNIEALDSQIASNCFEYKKLADSFTIGSVRSGDCLVHASMPDPLLKTRPASGFEGVYQSLVSVKYFLMRCVMSPQMKLSQENTKQVEELIKKAPRPTRKDLLKGNQQILIKKIEEITEKCKLVHGYGLVDENLNATLEQFKNEKTLIDNELNTSVKMLLDDIAKSGIAKQDIENCQASIDQRVTAIKVMSDLQLNALSSYDLYTRLQQNEQLSLEQKGLCVLIDLRNNMISHTPTSTLETDLNNLLEQVGKNTEWGKSLHQLVAQMGENPSPQVVQNFLQHHLNQMFLGVKADMERVSFYSRNEEGDATFRQKTEVLKAAAENLAIGSYGRGDQKVRPEMMDPFLYSTKSYGLESLYQMILSIKYLLLSSIGLSKNLTFSQTQPLIDNGSNLQP